jgi:hypothetical protein
VWISPGLWFCVWSFGDRVETILVPLSPWLGRIQPWHIKIIISAIFHHLSLLIPNAVNPGLSLSSLQVMRFRSCVGRTMLLSGWGHCLSVDEHLIVLCLSFTIGGWFFFGHRSADDWKRTIDTVGIGVVVWSSVLVGLMCFFVHDSVFWPCSWSESVILVWLIDCFVAVDLLIQFLEWSKIVLLWVDSHLSERSTVEYDHQRVSASFAWHWSTG